MLCFGLRGETQRDIFLDDDVNLIDQIRERKKMVKNRRRDVIRQIAVQTNAAAGSQCGEISFQNIAVNHRKVRKFLRKPF